MESNLLEYLFFPLDTILFCTVHLELKRIIPSRSMEELTWTFVEVRVEKFK